MTPSGMLRPLSLGACSSLGAPSPSSPAPGPPETLPPWWVRTVQVSWWGCPAPALGASITTRPLLGSAEAVGPAVRARRIPHSSSLRCAACLPSLHANSKQAVIILDALNNCGYFFSSQYSKKAKNSLRFLSQLFFFSLALFSFLPTTSVTLKNQADELPGCLCSPAVLRLPLPLLPVAGIRG